MKSTLLIGMALGFATGGVLAEPLPADTGVKWDLSPAVILDSCTKQIADAEAKIHAVDARVATDPKPALLLEIEADVADMNDALAAQTLLLNVALAKDVRDASTKCVEQVSAFGVKVNADPVIYAIAQGAMKDAAKPEERRLAELYVEGGRRAGAGLPDKKRAQVTALFDRLNKLTLDFGRALGEDHTTIAISDKEAESLQPAFVKTLKPGKDGGYVVTVNESTVLQFLKGETSPAARKRYYIAYNNRGGAANVKRLEAAVALRDQLAHELGFKSWAAYQLDAKMAKTPDRVLALLNKVNEASLPKAHAEIAVLADMKKAAGDNTPFEVWDYSFYESQLEKAKYNVDREAVRQYFPVGKVISAVFSIYEKLLGVHFDAISPPVTWAPDVTEYSITDTATGAPIGWFFLDLYPREGKYDHVAMFPLRAGRVMPDGSVQKPIQSIIGNWPVGEPGKPALLSHDEVITFFHEFGHLMHNALSKAPYETVFGTNVRNDFVEAPSQMLENWMWQPAVLKEVSSNVTTGEPIPDELINKMIAAKHVADGVIWSRQSFLATYDMRLHSSGPKVDATKLWFDLAAKMTTFKAQPGTIPEAGFGHLMSGYDAGYYGYLWSLVYAQDMFSVFAKEGVENPVVGMRYRKEILERGALAEPDVLLHNFLGRDISYDPFYQYIGITPP